jgi:hypothetical protein
MKFYYLLMVLLLSVISYAQNLSGKITDVSENPLVDVYIYNESSDVHAHTNEFGNFTLTKVNLGDAFKISKIGYKPVFFTITQLNEKVKITLEEEIFKLSEVTISPNVNINSTIAKLDLNTNPVNSSQEILRKVPGLFIGQHAGGGKAEQLFLRGFDIDHGTDVALSADGIPVNMVSHAHGQGYADLHFIIPETVNNIDFGKGPYNAAKGNFATAGYVDFKTKDKLDESKLSVEVGQFNTIRTVGLFDLLGNKTKSNAYLATEYIETDGPFDSPQNFIFLVNIQQY